MDSNNNTLLNQKKKKRGPSTYQNMGIGTGNTNNSGCHFRKGKKYAYRLFSRNQFMMYY